MIDVDALAQEIRRVDGNHSLGACQLAEALVPFFEAALRAAVPEGEPVAKLLVYRSAACNGRKMASIKGFDTLIASLDVGEHPLFTHPAPRPDMERAVRWEQLAEMLNAGFRNARRINADFHIDAQKLREFVAADLHPAPRPDVERELAEARAEIERIHSLYGFEQRGRLTAEAERDALAADKARLVEALERILLEIEAGAPSTAYQIASDALSGASIPAPADETEARRGALEEAANHARCAFDDRPRRDSFEWNDGFDDGTKAAAAAIRALISTPARREGE